MSDISGEIKMEVNPHSQPEVLMVGNECTPIVVVDDFLKATGELIDQACNSVFTKGDRPGYPGVHSKLPEAYVSEALGGVTPLIRRFYSVPDDFQCATYHERFSLTCTPESDLAVLQRIPHVDTQRSYYFAILHYLNAGDYGGTGFYRHRPTQYERISERRNQNYLMAAKQFMAVNGLPENRYCQGSDSHYELIANVDYRPNRVVIYPGNLLHSGLISGDRDLSKDPANGRLTANIFIDFDKPS